MSKMPRFAMPGTYVRYVGPSRDFPTKKQGSNSTHYLRLKDREAPLKYYFRFTNLTVGASNRSQVKSFKDLELAPEHVAQVFLGVSYGGRLRVWHPTDSRLLKWDQTVSDIVEQDTGNIEHDDSPISNPRFEFWLAPTPNFVPGLDAENIEALIQPPRTLNVDVAMYAALYNYEFVEPAKEADVYDKLVKYQIPSRPISFGGGVKIYR